jgi:hypothetical protein
MLLNSVGRIENSNGLSREVEKVKKESELHSLAYLFFLKLRNCFGPTFRLYILGCLRSKQRIFPPP